MRIQYYLTCFCLLLLGASNLQAQTQYVGPNNGDWLTPVNWNNSLPAAGNDAQIYGVVTVAINSPLNVNFNITAFGNISATDAVAIATGGSISNSGTMGVASSGSLTNSGTFRNSVRTKNEGSFVNNAYLHNPGDFTNATGATLTNNEIFFIEAGNLLNEGTFANKNKAIVDECSSAKNTGASTTREESLICMAFCPKKVP